MLGVMIHILHMSYSYNQAHCTFFIGCEAVWELQHVVVVVRVEREVGVGVVVVRVEVVEKEFEVAEPVSAAKCSQRKI
jgi:hypothetical protein